jgi:hypothetical protein
VGRITLDGLHCQVCAACTKSGTDRLCRSKLERYLSLFNQVFPDQLSEDAKQNGGKANDDPTDARSLRHFPARDFYSPERLLPPIVLDSLLTASDQPHGYRGVW